MNLGKLNKNELILKCEELGITKCKSKNKNELIKLINDKQLLPVNNTPENPTSNNIPEVINNNNISEVINNNNIPEIINNNNISENPTPNNIAEVINNNNIAEVINDNNIAGVLKIVSIFAGCGGLDFGFHNNPKYKHVLVNDFDKDACDTYEKNFNIKPECCDIKTLLNIPDFDLLIGGFPCQGFSMANPKRSETDERNKLYLEILRILKQKKPSYFMLENVKGILSMGGYDTPMDKTNKTGRIVKHIIEDLKECGYKVEFKLFKLKNFDIPQNRERVIFIGVRNDVEFEIVWPKENNKKITLKDAIGDLPIEYNNDIQHIGTKHKCNVNGFLGNRELKWDEPSPTITGRGGGSGGPVIHNHPSLKRRLTVRECARIQTFPDTFIFSGSVSSMYKQIGNAVPCKFSTYLSNIFQ